MIFLLNKMNSKYKVAILSLLFLLPVATFLFLKFFGKNKFEIPLLKNTEGVAQCDSTLINVLTEDINLVFVKKSICEKSGCSIEFDQLKRVAQRYKEAEGFRYSILSDEEVTVDWKFKNISAYNYKDSLSLGCLGLNDNRNYFLLFDKKKQLRGSYEIERSEVDRLIIELDILNKYE